MNKRCICGHDESDHADGDCIECGCSAFVADPDNEPEETGYVFD